MHIGSWGVVISSSRRPDTSAFLWWYIKLVARTCVVEGYGLCGFLAMIDSVACEVELKVVCVLNASIISMSFQIILSVGFGEVTSRE